MRDPEEYVVFKCEEQNINENLLFIQALRELDFIQFVLFRLILPNFGIVNSLISENSGRKIRYHDHDPVEWRICLLALPIRRRTARAAPLRDRAAAAER